MNKKHRYVFIALFFALFAVHTAAETTVSIKNVFVDPEGNVTASIMIGNVTNIGVADISLTFNQLVVWITATVNSDFDFLHMVINNSVGEARIGAFQISSTGLNGNVKLADIQLDAVGFDGETSMMNLSINELKEMGTPETPIYSEIDNGTFTIINPPEPPIILTNATGIFWINWTWTSGPNIDFNEVKINGSWVENCTKQYYNCTYPPHAARTISLRGYNHSLDKYSTYNNQTTIISNHMPVAVARSMHHHNNVGSVYLCKTYFNASASYDPDGSIMYYQWIFGDGTNGTGALSEHIYSSWNWNGTGYDPFIVSLIVTDDVDPQINDTITIPVNVYIAGDANGDGEVDIFDATIVGLEWDRTCKYDNWTDRSDRADLNNDCMVDIFDAVIIGANWEHTAY
jgi:hypothetical protein